MSINIDAMKKRRCRDIAEGVHEAFMGSILFSGDGRHYTEIFIIGGVATLFMLGDAVPQRRLSQRRVFANMSRMTRGIAMEDMLQISRPQRAAAGVGFGALASCEAGLVAALGGGCGFGVVRGARR